MFIVTFKRSIYKGKMSSSGCVQSVRHCAKHFTGIISSDPSLCLDYAIVSLLMTPVFGRFALQLFFIQKPE